MSRGEVCFFPTRRSTVSSKRVEALRVRVLHDYHDPSQLKYLTNVLGAYTTIRHLFSRLLDTYVHAYWVL